MGRGHMHHMFAPAEADLQPDPTIVAEDRRRVDRLAFGIFLHRDSVRPEIAQILGQITLLAVTQGLAMPPAIEIAARRIGIEGGFRGIAHARDLPQGRARVKPSAGPVASRDDRGRCPGPPRYLERERSGDTKLITLANCRNIAEPDAAIFSREIKGLMSFLPE